ncbi:hypothetical protein [uncultured Nitratireductor sp.]|uniref:hypothetical protein n=1 Tax=uncultured Nitratireductor sp. TaxID=520953 RepID=UPI0025D893A4|nr:hypothetical protein [uncultured Nitratireductor sp.]
MEHECAYDERVEAVEFFDGDEHVESGENATVAVIWLRPEAAQELGTEAVSIEFGRSGAAYLAAWDWTAGGDHEVEFDADPERNAIAEAFAREHPDSIALDHVEDAVRYAAEEAAAA